MKKIYHFGICSLGNSSVSKSCIVNTFETTSLTLCRSPFAASTSVIYYLTIDVKERRTSSLRGIKMCSGCKFDCDEHQSIPQKTDLTLISS